MLPTRERHRRRALRVDLVVAVRSPSNAFDCRGHRRHPRALAGDVSRALRPTFEVKEKAPRNIACVRGERKDTGANVKAAPRSTGAPPAVAQSGAERGGSGR